MSAIAAPRPCPTTVTDDALCCVSACLTAERTLDAVLRMFLLVCGAMLREGGG